MDSEGWLVGWSDWAHDDGGLRLVGSQVWTSIERGLTFVIPAAFMDYTARFPLISTTS